MTPGCAVERSILRIPGTLNYPDTYQVLWDIIAVAVKLVNSDQTRLETWVILRPSKTGGNPVGVMNDAILSPIVAQTDAGGKVRLFISLNEWSRRTSSEGKQYHRNKQDLPVFCPAQRPRPPNNNGIGENILE